MECEPLAASEALAAASALGGMAKVVLSEPGILVIDTKANPRALASRLGLCHYVSQYLGTCGGSELESYACEVDVEGPIRVHSTKIGASSIDLAAASRRIGAVLGKTRGVDLRSPKSDIRLVFSENVHVGVVEGAIDRSAFEKRKNRYMPFVYPASLHPKYARALVNLTGVAADGRVLDPFCGTGAIVAEASIIGLDAIGSDFSEKMLGGARRNLAHLGLKSELHLCDVGDIPDGIGMVDGIATDPPYGRATTTDGEEISELYGRAFRAFHEVLGEGSKVAIVVPDVDLVRHVQGFRSRGSFALRVHRSLTRHFCVFERT